MKWCRKTVLFVWNEHEQIWSAGLLMLEEKIGTFRLVYSRTMISPNSWQNKELFFLVSNYSFKNRIEGLIKTLQTDTPADSGGHITGTHSLFLPWGPLVDWSGTAWASNAFNNWSNLATMYRPYSIVYHNIIQVGMLIEV